MSELGLLPHGKKMPVSFGTAISIDLPQAGRIYHMTCERTT
jgi:hypothetical protein